MKELAEICRERGYRRLEWKVLDWNTVAIDFYTSIGAKVLNGWARYRVSDAALHNL